MKKEYVIFLLVIFLFVGCAPNVKLIEPTGRQIPSPQYMLQSTSDIQIQTVSYWASFKSKKDLDGTTILKPKFIPYTRSYVFSRKKFSGVTLTVEVKNPKLVKYQLLEHLTIVDERRRNVKYNRRIVGISDLYYRLFTINLPFREEHLGKVTYGLDLIVEDGMPIMHFGDLNYNLTK